MAVDALVRIIFHIMVFLRQLQVRLRGNLALTAVAGNAPVIGYVAAGVNFIVSEDNGFHGLADNSPFGRHPPYRAGFRVTGDTGDAGMR